ncbi:MAG: hypothetical protein H6718_33390 [Polyangiaceae bacterium]|nr:hypothetical protein [Myxococcales bacterium]MCB9590353.1 hypothetical protein [Polyangiaceae bacterium]MCB9604992.1 hypothetical protein [Polyangiaceae bacterium]
MSRRMLPWAVALLGMGLATTGSAEEKVTKTDDGGYKVEIKRDAPPPKADTGGDKSSDKGDAAEGKETKASRTGGYSWTDKPRRRYRPVKIDPKWAIATFPGFRMLQDGSSEVSVWLSKKVSVDVRKAERSVTLVLSETYVRWTTNTYPLITTHFNTPLSSARLKRGKKGETLLVLTLREAADVKSRLEVGPRGSSILRVSIPAPRQEFVKAEQRVPLAVLPATRQ